MSTNIKTDFLNHIYVRYFIMFILSTNKFSLVFVPHNSASYPACLIFVSQKFLTFIHYIHFYSVCILYHTSSYTLRCESTQQTCYVNDLQYSCVSNNVHLIQYETRPAPVCGRWRAGGLANSIFYSLSAICVERKKWSLS